MRKTLVVLRRHVLQSRGVGLFGALGTGSFQDQAYFTTVELSDHLPTYVSAGLGHSAVITSEGKLAIFGRAFDLRSLFKSYGIYRFVPIFAIWASKLTLLDDQDPHAQEILLSPKFLSDLNSEIVKAVKCSGGLTNILTESGKLYCIGVNNYGQCGLGETKNRYWRPIIPISVPPVIDSDIGLQHSICLCVNGEVYTWGKGENGQLGTGETNETNVNPILVHIPKPCVAVAAGLNHCAVIDSSGSIYVWGRRMSSELEDGKKHTYLSK